MRKIKMIVVLVQILLLQSINAQEKSSIVFNDSLIFIKWGVHNSPYCVQYLGDQNNDGYDDFLITNLNENNDYITELYHGGRTIDTIPYLKFHSYGFINCESPYLGTVDMNGDGYKDIVMLKDTISPRKLSVLFGGPQMDTIPDMFIPLPNVSPLIELMIFNHDGYKIDFDGDDNEELAFFMWAGDTPTDYGEIHELYLVKTGTKFTGELIPTIKTSESLRQPIYLSHTTIADIDGDGCSDIFLADYQYTDSTLLHQLGVTMTIFYGDNNLWFDSKLDLTQSLLYSFLLPDMNHDGKGEYCAYDRRGIGAPTYNSFLVNGGCPPDTMPLLSSGNYYYFPTAGLIQPIGDINGDGYTDIIVTGSNPVRPWVARVLLGGTGRFYHSSTDMYEYGVSMIGRVGDINGDGCEDMVLGQYNIHAPGKGQAGYVKIYAGKRIAMSTVEETKIEDNRIELACYPNPTTGELKVVYSLPQNVNNAFLSVYDMLGKEIKHIELQPSPGRKEASINLKEENISSGVYIANLRYHEKGELKNKAIKIQYVK